MQSLHEARPWYSQAWKLIQAQVPPETIQWQDARQLSLSLDELSETPQSRPIHLPPTAFFEALPFVLCHSDFAKHRLLYRLLWRLSHSEPFLMDIKSDTDVVKVEAMKKAVLRDLHKMKAFVRFREFEGHYLAWYEPDHFVLRLAAPFFARRFGDRPWSILTPHECAHWDLEKLHWTHGVTRADAALGEDQLENLWRLYYASIFNPARLKLKAMQREMPRKRWLNLPESRVIAEACREAPRRLSEMAKLVKPSAQAFVPETRDLQTLKQAAPACKGCDLYKHATQVVFGDGPVHAPLMIVGEQPGDKEDLSGHPFVGPAGKLFDEALARLGMDRTQCYITNAVKHFKFTPRGKFRLHQKPLSSEIAACRPWLKAETETVAPKVILCMGATAAQGVLGRSVKIGEIRGQVLDQGAYRVVVTVHPSAILRTEDPVKREEEFERFVTEMALAYEASKE